MSIRPLADKLVIEIIDVLEQTSGGIFIPDSAKEKPQEAVVIAVGPGKCENGKKTEMHVKEGDKVIFSKYSGTEVNLDDEEYIIVKQNDILAVVK